MSSLKLSTLCAAALLLVATCANAAPPGGRGRSLFEAPASGRVASLDKIRGQAPVMHTGGEECGCSACVKHETGWRSKMSHLLDLCCMKKRWFRHVLPYNSCYKPVPPYLINHNGYNNSCWRRLSDPARPCHPVLEGYPVEIQPLATPIEETDDFLMPKESNEAPPAPVEPNAPPLPDDLEG